jgi:colanic acid/amylovoran biosynthesis glycosyltransferase
LNLKQNNFIVSRLGIINNLPRPKHSNDKIFRIVSCSSVIALKRIDCLIKALQLIDDLAIEWTHIGSGDLFDTINDLAKITLCYKKNIRYIFKGFMENNKILNFYSNNYIDVFINASSTEGLPVSIMEAFSFGIPAIAPNTGGINEIVNERNGILLEVNPAPEIISSAIKKIAALPESEKFKLRENAYLTWKEKFHAEKNYNDFIDEILAESINIK